MEYFLYKSYWLWTVIKISLSPMATTKPESGTNHIMVEEQPI